MKTGVDIDIVKEHYAGLTDSELIHIATTDAAGMTEEAQVVIKEEIWKRKLDVNLMKAVAVQNHEATADEVDQYCEMIATLPCPRCADTRVRLNGTQTMEVVSVIIVTYTEKKLKVACPRCLNKLTDAALSKSALLGWWGIPWGIARTIGAIVHNNRIRKWHDFEIPNDCLRAFVIANIGQIEMHRNNKEQLHRIIAAK